MVDGAEMLRHRISRFWDGLGNANVSDDVRSMAREVLELAEQVVVTAASTSRRDLSETALFGSVNTALNALREVLQRVNNVVLLEWVRSTAESIPNSLLFPFQGWDLTAAQRVADSAPELAQRANLLLDNYSLEDERERILDDARRSAAEAEVAAVKAKQSAGVTGSSSLATHFSTYASQERRAAESFRGLAIAGVVGALVAAVAFGPIAPDDWTHLTYRIAIVAAAGTLAAYFARQAGQHRRVYNWAKSLEVQLKSFPAFVEPVPEAERVEIYRAFARRVLSGPPEKGVEAAEDSVGAAQVLDLVTALAKRT